jgi:phosphatidylinositol alpha-1,6-mannosyltransferase
MRKIALITEAFPPMTGGSSRWFFEIYRRLPRDRVIVAAGEVAGCEEFDGTHDLSVRRLPLTLADLGLTNPRSALAYGRLARRIRRIALAEGVDVLHSGRCLPDGWIAWILNQLSGMPYLCFVHGEEVKLGAAGSTGIMSSRQMRWMARCVFRGAEVLIANSQNTRRILVEEWGLPPELIRTLTPGVDTDYFRPADRDPEARRLLGWGDRDVVLTAGRLIPRKGHDRMILALGAIRRAVPDVLYCIVGDGPQAEALRGLVAREGLGDHVQFLGESTDDELLRCYQQCDLFVLPNRQIGQDIEGFGMVLLEAQACGKPVVAGESGGTAETMRVAETGRVVDADDPRELAEVVVDLLSDRDRLDRVGSAARRWAVERFDWESLGRMALRAFDGMVPNQAEPAEGPPVAAAGEPRR